MVQASEKTTGTGNTALPYQGDHDRVQMLSVRADGTPDQHNPEMIGDPEDAKAATRQQFREQSVSAEDVRLRGVVADTGAETVEQDPQIKEMQAAHQKVEQAAEKAADAAVEKLTTGETPGTPAAAAKQT